MARAGGSIRSSVRAEAGAKMIRRQWAALMTIAGLSALTWSASATAGLEEIRNFNREDQQLLRQYKSITRKFSFFRAGARYLGAISYQVLRMPPERVYALLEEVNTTLPYLPATHQAKRVSSPDELGRVQMVHGNAWLQGGYTVVWEPHPSQNLIRFWMDPELPHDVADIWGYFRLQPFEGGKSLLTVAVAVAPGEGYKGPIWEKKIHKYMLKSARYLRKYVDRLIAKEQRPSPGH